MHLYMYTNSTIALKQSRKYIWLISIGNAMWPAGFLIPCKDSISWMGVRMLVSPRYQGLPVWLWHLNLKHDNNNCIGKSWFWLDQKSRELVASTTPSVQSQATHPDNGGKSATTQEAIYEWLIWLTHDALRRGLVNAGLLSKVSGGNMGNDMKPSDL